MFLKETKLVELIVKKNKAKKIGFARRQWKKEPSNVRIKLARRLVREVFVPELCKKLVGVTVFGSVAERKAAKQSDLDIMLFVDGWRRISDEERLDIYRRLFKKTKRHWFDIVVDFKIFEGKGFHVLPFGSDKVIYGWKKSWKEVV